MDSKPVNLSAEPAPIAPGFWDHPRWNLVLTALILWQVWMTLTLFGTDRPWRHLFSDEPIVSGKHPLHLYHGFLGAHSFFETGSLCCYDPNFQAGYPKTPVFDGGSRPGELFLILTGGNYNPLAYKIGLALCCLAVPVLLALGARGAGLSRGATTLAALAGLFIWWGKPCTEALEAGELHLLIAAVASVAQVGMLIRFDRLPCLRSWLGLLLTGYLAWFAHPLFAALQLPLMLVYYLCAGPKHGVVWHAALLGSVAGAIASNSFWLIDWVNYWWVRKPAAVCAPLLSHRTLHTLWDAPLWGGALDRGLVVFLFAAAIVGVWIMNETQKRPAARLLGTAAAGGILLTLGSLCWQPVAQMGAAQLSVPAQFFAIIPAVHAVQVSGQMLARLLKSPMRVMVVSVGASLLGMALVWPEMLHLAKRCMGSQPLVLGLNADRLAIVRKLKEETDSDARILWEDRSDQASECWTALLPRLTDRAFVGGLDTDADTEHSYASFIDQILAGQTMTSLSDQDIDKFCKQYNIGWIVCWTPGAIERLRHFPGAHRVADFQDNGSGVLFALDRPHSFALLGHAELLHADCQRITLGNVVPENGKVILSLHYQKGMQVSPSRVQIERDIDAQDPINFVRLRIPDTGPVARVTVTWEQH
jgi:hypothetical protein